MSEDINKILERAAKLGIDDRARTGKPFHMTRNVPGIWGNRKGYETIVTREEAIELIERARGKTPADWLSWMHVGQALHIVGASELALERVQIALDMHPCAETMMNVAVILECFGRFDEALGLATRATMLDPKDQFAGLLWAQGHLRQGHWAEAWPSFEHYCWGRIWEIGLEKYIPQWQGESLVGKKILVLQGGGFGDNLMFFRWFRDLKERGAHITYAVNEWMVPLLEGHPWVDRIIPMTENQETDDLPEVDMISQLGNALGQIVHGEPEGSPREVAIRNAFNEGMEIPEICAKFDCKYVPGFDYFVPIMGIPRRLMATVASVEAQPEPYITAPEPRVNLGGKPFVGVCWMGAEKLDPRRHRSLNVKQAEKLLKAGEGKVDWINLQHEMKAPVSIYSPKIQNWRDTANIIASCSLVITVDTGVMHLAGAMGKPTWAMLPGLSDWKFLLGRDTMAFYPSVRLFRNSGEGMENALLSVMEALQTL